MSKNIVGIEEITSGSYSKKVFSFYDPQHKIIDIAPFVLRSPNDYYRYPHHIDQENFHMWVERTHGRISAYDERQGSLTQWGDETKATLFELISEGIQWTANESIEDLFSTEDFYQYVLRDTSPAPDDGVPKNSQLAGGRKVILAKQFYEAVLAEPDLSLSLETEGNILRILHQVGLSPEKLFVVQSVPYRSGISDALTRGLFTYLLVESESSCVQLARVTGERME